jgi:hypothetical protein
MRRAIWVWSLIALGSSEIKKAQNCENPDRSRKSYVGI